MRMWRKRNFCALLVGMQAGGATVGNRLELTQQIERLHNAAMPILDMCPEKVRTPIRKGISTKCSLQHH